jgi:hypothetical protein
VNHPLSANSTQESLPLSRQSRYAHAFLFSLNLALVFKLEGNQRPNRFFSFFENGEASLQIKVNALLHLHPHNAVGANTAFLILALALAALILLILTVLLRLPSFERLFRSTAGAISLIALPVAWLCVSQLLGVPAPLPNPPNVLLYAELIGAVATAILYLYAKWPAPAWLSVVLLGVHFGFWNWIVSGGPYFWRDPFRLVFPLVGLAATLLWAIYISTTRPPAAD